jgi:hypothetical protein
MTTIQANINISGTTTPLDGYIRVLIESSFSDDTTLFVPVYKDFALTDGAATFELDPSDSAKVSYKFQIYQNVADTIGEDENGDPVTIENADILVKEFKAVVPYSVTTINFKDLASQVGVRYDAQDAALLTLARYLQASDTFWGALVQNVWNLKGEWSSSLFYKRGDVVTYNGSAYQYIQSVASSTNLPTNTTYWRLLVSKGDTGTGTAGNNAAYSSAWDGQTDAPSRNAVYDKVNAIDTSITSINTTLGTKANLASPVFTGTPTAPTAASNNNSLQVATTAFVQSVVAPVPPVGTIAVWPTASAPSKWRALTSTGELLSRTTYSVLFGVIGTAFMTNSDAGSLTTQFRTPKSTDFPTLTSTVGGSSTGSFVWMIYTGV